MKLLSTLGVGGVLRELLPAFDGAVELAAGPTAQLIERIEGGERADVAILTAEGVARLTSAGVLAGERRDLAVSTVGIAVKAGAPKPEIGSVEAFVATLHRVRSISYSRSGASGLFFAGLIGRLGLAEMVNAKAVIRPKGLTAELAANGEVELAVQQISELMQVPGVDIVGPLPAEIGSVTVFSAACFAGAAADGAGFVRWLAERATPELLRRHGLEAVAA